MTGRRTIVHVGEIAHVLLCVAMAIPLALVALAGTPWGILGPDSVPAALPTLLSFLAIFCVLATTFASFVRPLQIATARVLLDLPLPDAIAAPTVSTRLLGVGWFLLCAAVGFVVAVAFGIVLPLAVQLALAPLAGDAMRSPPFPTVVLTWGPAPIVALVAGLLLMSVCIASALAAGRALSSFAPVFLGPTDADRRVLDERRAAAIARANAIARELHDSVGHALTAITVQASAARATRGSDDDASLSRIEDLARGALEELDTALGALRRGTERADTVPNGRTVSNGRAMSNGRATPSGAPSPRHAASTAEGAPANDPGTDGRESDPSGSAALLQAVLATARRVLDVDAETIDVAEVPEPAASEAVRIVQESLTNAVRHGDGAAELRMTRHGGHLRIRVRNRLAEQPHATRVGGRGLAGMVERATLLGGTLDAGRTADGHWLVEAELPIEPAHAGASSRRHGGGS